MFAKKKKQKVLIKKYVRIRSIGWATWVTEFVFPILMLALFCTPFAINSPFTSIPLRTVTPSSGTINPLEFYTSSPVYPAAPADEDFMFVPDSWSGQPLQIWFAGAEENALVHIAGMLNQYYQQYGTNSSAPEFKVTGSQYDNSLDTAYLSNNGRWFAGVNFEAWPFGSNSSGNLIQYQLRMNGTAFASTEAEVSMQAVPYMGYFDTASQIDWTKYLSTGYISLQRVINAAASITADRCRNGCSGANGGSDAGALRNLLDKFPASYQTFSPPRPSGGTKTQQDGQCRPYSDDLDAEHFLSRWAFRHSHLLLPCAFIMKGLMPTC